ncbi:MAG: SLAC1 anion channel family protein [Candidatus Woesearchaeota archaeon]|nr:SLAC1 anion channel family protein [Candidatus Woesearchaeota archaeon]
MKKENKINLLRLQNFPISFFAIIVGMTGFTLLLMKIEELFELNSIFSTYSLYFTNFIFVIITLFYLIKLIKYRKDVVNEFHHPVKMNFFPLIAKSFIILSIIYLTIDLTISKYLWVIGAIFQFGFTITILSFWINKDKFKIKHMSPAWFVPIVGNILLPIAGIVHFNEYISWFFFSIGLVFWLILFVIFINRIIFHEPLESKLVPTFFIAFAPPAIGFIAYIKLVGEFDAFAKILYFLALFLFILIIAQYKMFSKIDFYLSWWVYSFPLAAITIATILFYHLSGEIFFKYLAAIMFFLFVVILVLLLVRTIYAISKKRICIEE